MFEVAAEVFHHRAQIVDLLKMLSRSGTLNPKVKSVLLDLQDEKLLAMMQALAVCFCVITGPYWHLVTSGNAQYLDLYQYIQPMHQKLSAWVENPMAIVNERSTSLFEDFPPNRHHHCSKVLLMSHPQIWTCLEEP